MTAPTAPKRRWLTVGVLSVLQLVENSEGGLINSLFPVIRADLGITRFYTTGQGLLVVAMTEGGPAER